MNRREAMAATAAALAMAAAPTVGATGPVATTTAAEPIKLRPIWKWYERTQEWVRVRMDALKPGDRFDIEMDDGERHQCIATAHPKYGDSGYGTIDCGIICQQIGTIRV